MKKFIHIIFAVVILLTTTCKKEKYEEKNGSLVTVQKTKYKENTTVIDSATNSRLIGIDSSKLVFSSKTEKTNNIKVGDVIISGISSQTPQGYLRKVTNINESNGNLTIETEQALLTDAITDIAIDTTVVINASSGLKSSSTLLKTQDTHIIFSLNKIIYDADNDTTTESDQIKYSGEFSIDITYNFKLTIKSGIIQQFELSSNTVNVLTNNIYLGKNLGSFSKEITLISLQLPPIEPSGIVLVPYLRIYVGAEGQISASISATQTTTYLVYAGLKKENGNWSLFSDQSLNGNILFSGVDITATAKAYVKPSLDIEFFDCKNAKAQIYVRGYALLKANPNETPWWDFYAGIDAKAELTLKALFGLIDFNYTQDIFDKSWLLASADIQNTGLVYDYDGNIYKTVKIGNQWWMAENLKSKHYANGNIINGAYSYNNDSKAIATYGHLYTWDVATRDVASNLTPSGVQGVCPVNWHIPSQDEWGILIDYLGGTTIAGGKMKELGTEHWNAPNGGATNESGFNALPSGYGFSPGNSYMGLGSYAYYWSTTQFDSTLFFYTGLDYLNPICGNDGNTTKGVLYSIRCIKDDAISKISLPTIATDSISAITQTSASSGGNITDDGGASVTVRGVCWSTSQNPTTADNKTTNGSGIGSFTSSLTGLTANTTYYLRAYATNGYGTGYGSAILFKTICNICEITP